MVYRFSISLGVNSNGAMGLESAMNLISIENREECQRNSLILKCAKTSVGSHLLVARSLTLRFSPERRHSTGEGAMD